MKTIQSREAIELLREHSITKTETLYDGTFFIFHLSNGQRLRYEVRSGGGGCDSCGYGNEPIVEWSLEEVIKE